MPEIKTLPNTSLGRTWYLLAPALLLVVSLALTCLGGYIYHYRDGFHAQDPTTYHLNSLVSFSILVPAVVGCLLSVIALIQRVYRLRQA